MHDCTIVLSSPFTSARVRLSDIVSPDDAGRSLARPSYSVNLINESDGGTFLLVHFLLLRLIASMRVGKPGNEGLQIKIKITADPIFSLISIYLLIRNPFSGKSVSN